MRADEAAADRAQPADDDDDEHQHHDLAADARRSASPGRAPTSRRRGRPAPSPPRTRRRTGGGCDSRAPRPSRCSRRRRGSAGRSWCGSSTSNMATNTASPTTTASMRYFSIADVAEDESRRASAVGSVHRLLLGAPDHVDQLLGDDQAAHGDQDLLEVLAVDRPDDDALEGPAEQRRCAIIAASMASSPAPRG